MGVKQVYMIYHQFPDLQWLKTQAEKNFADRKGIAGRSLSTKGWPNVILNVSTRDICRDDIRGPVSIFTNLSGESRVSVKGGGAVIKQDTFLITNYDQRYTLEVDSTPTQTFNIHFGEFFTEQVYDAVSRNPASFLEENEFTTPFEKINFYNKVYTKTEDFNRVASEILNAKGNDLLLEEKLFEMMVVLLREQTKIVKGASAIPTIKQATREEILRRLFKATDFIYSNTDVDISLDQLASISCLSKFHFLRLFKIVFRQTPHQFIIEMRIRRAKELLKRTHLDISAIGRELGYRDSSTFSRTFYNAVGVYPSQFRHS